MKKTRKSLFFSKKSFAKFCHDLRTPLSVMRMSLDVFEMSKEYKAGKKKTAHFVKIMNKQIDSLIEKISNAQKEK